MTKAQQLATTDPLTTDMAQGAELLADGASIAEVAARLSVARTTVYRWLDNEEFTEYAQLLRARARDSRRALREKNVRSAQIVWQEVIDGTLPRNCDRAKAAETLLSQTEWRVYERDDPVV